MTREGPEGHPALFCPKCGTGFPVKGGVLDLYPRQDYLFTIKSVSGERLRTLLQDMAARGWSKAYWDFVEKYFGERPVRSGLRRKARDLYLALNGRSAPGLLHTVLSEAQAYHWILTSLPSDGVALDFGAGWGRVPHVLARECAWVVAADATLERLQFSAMRAAEDGVRNLSFVRTGTEWRLPFASETFDLVTINGVLEWIPTSQAGRPREIQLRHLREVARILKPDGQVIIGIENRYALADLLGFPEGHVGLPWAGVLSRPLADVVSRLAGRGPMRVRTWSADELRALLEEAGFSRRGVALFAPQPTYSQYDVEAAVDSRAREVLAPATLFQHPAVRRRAPEGRWRALARPSVRHVAAFHAVGGKGEFRCYLTDLATDLDREAGIRLVLPLDAVRIRETKAMFRAEEAGDGLTARGRGPRKTVHVSIAMSQRGESQMQREVTVLRRLASCTPSRMGSLRVPSVRFAGRVRGHSVSVLDSIAGKPLIARATPGTSWEDTIDAVALLREALREVSLEWLEDDGEPRTLEGLWRYRWGFLRSLRALRGMEGTIDRVEEALWVRRGTNQNTAVLGHRDLLPGNILSLGGAPGVGVIDWDHAGPAHPWEDEFAAMVGHARAEFGGFGRAVAALAGSIGNQRSRFGGFAQLVSRECADRPEECLLTIIMVWLRHLQHAEGSYLVEWPEWIRCRATNVLRILERVV